MRRKTAILLFEDIEVLDFAGPYEVFSVADQIHGYQYFDVFTVGIEAGPIKSINGLRVQADYSIEDAPVPDILIIPGGDGSHKVIGQPRLMNWIEATHSQADMTLSVCTGARILAHLGILKGRPYCTHQSAYAELATLVPDGDPKPYERFVGTQNLYTAAGVAAGIDLSLHIVGKLHGEEVSVATGKYMEYPDSHR